MSLHVHEFVVPGHEPSEHDTLVDVRIAESFNRLLKEIDDRLFCFWVKADAVAFDNPGRWHIGREHSNPELNVYWCITTTDGGYREPNDSDLDWLREHDSHTRNVLGDIQARRSTRQIQSAKRFEERRREFREKLYERLEYNYSSTITVPRRASEPPVKKNDHLVLPPSARVDRP